MAGVRARSSHGIHFGDRGRVPPLEFRIDRYGSSAVGSSLDRDHAVAHGEDERLQPRRDLELGEDVRHVGVYRSLANVEPTGDLLVAQALGEGLNHLALPRGQPGAGELGLAVTRAHAREVPQGLYDLLLGEK